MNDRSISAITATAFVFWAIGLALVLAGITLGAPEWGDLGLLAACVGATLNVRKFLCDTAHRERAAFMLGQELGRSERDESNVRSMNRG